MPFSSLGFLVGEAGRNVRRNGLMSVAALTTVTVALAVLGGALFTLYRLHQFADAQPKQFEIQAFLAADTTGAQGSESGGPSAPTASRRHRRRRHHASDTTGSVTASSALAMQAMSAADAASRKKTLDVADRIRQLPFVAAVSLYTREQAFVDLQANDRRNGTNIADALEGNPLPDRLDVRATDPARLDGIAQAIRDRSRFPEIDNVQDDRVTLDQVLGLARVVRNVGGVAAIVLCLATALVVQNTIRLTVFARRREIRIMQLVGATPGFIRLPMILEGLFYGVAGAVVAAGIVLFSLHELSTYVSRFNDPFTQSMPPAAGPLVVLGAMAGLGALVGWTGSALSVRRFLRRI